MDSGRGAQQAGRVSPFGHRRVAGRLPPRRRFSQAATSFIASHRLGIRRMRLFAWPCNPNRPGRGAASRLRFSCASLHLRARAAPPPGPAGRPRRRTHVRIPNCKRSTAATRPPGTLPATRKPAPQGRACGSPQTRLGTTAKKKHRATRRGAGGAREDRTHDLLRARQALSQLSYGPSRSGPRRWWVREESNLRPHPYQGCALTN
jgi:hypothetical protein